MVIGKLIEVGVAVTDLIAASETFAQHLGTRSTRSIHAPMFSMDFRMCRLGDVDFELMTPCADDSVIGRFLSRRGEGLHHIAFQVPNIDSTIAHCREQAIPILFEEPVEIDGLRAIFLHPGCLSGLLVELVEGVHTWGETAPDCDAGPEDDMAHITGFGVAVRNADAAASQYASILGAEVSESYWNDQMGTHSRRALLGDIRFDLFPSSAAQVDRTKLDRHGQGLHHVCLQVGKLGAMGATARQTANSRNDRSQNNFRTSAEDCHGVLFEIRSDESD